MCETGSGHNKIVKKESVSQSVTQSNEAAKAKEEE